MNERTELTRLAERYRAALLDDCVPFWFPRAIDAQHGGFLHCFDRAGQLVDDDKSVWAQGRMSWMLLTLYRDVEPKPEWLQWAESGLAFLDRHAFDDDGRMFFQLARDGTPLRKRRYAFSECFASIAFAVHAQVTGDSKSAARAMTLFEQFVRWNFTPGLMPPKYTSARPMIGLSPRLMTIVTAQELRQSLGSHPALVTWIDRAIDEITRWFLKPDRQCLMETVSPTGEVLNHFDGRTLNPGHALEGAWFLMEEGHRTGRASLIEVGCQILDWMWPRGWDQKYGGILYFCDLEGHPVQEYWHDMKFWWPQNEALIATLYAWKLTGRERYLQWHQQLHDWCFQHLADQQFGEWYGYLHRDGTVASALKGSLWKSFFHHPRSMLRCWQLLTANVP